MARITRPPTIQGNAQIGLSGISGSPIASTVSSVGRELRSTNIVSGTLAIENAKLGPVNRSLQIAQQELQTKRELESLADSTNRQLLEEQKAFENNTVDAYRSGITQKSIRRATERFQLEAGARLKQEFDAFDNPTYKDMPKDIKSIGEKILSDTLKEIDDPIAAQDFRIAFKEQLGQDIQDASFNARQKQLVWDKKQLLEGVQQNIQVGARDSLENVDFHTQKAVNTLLSGLQSGILSEEEFTSGSKKVVETLKAANIENLIETDSSKAARILGLDLESTVKDIGVTPEQVKSFLGNVSETFRGQDLDKLGLTKEAQSYLKEKLSAKIGDDIRQFQKAQQAQEQELNRQRTELYQNLKARNDANILTATDIVESSGALGETLTLKLQSDFLKAEKANSNKNIVNLDISSRLNSNQSLSRFSTREIDNHYQDTVDATSSSQGQMVSLSQKAQIATAYGVPVKAFTQELEQTLASGSNQEAVEAVSAYIASKGSPATLNLSREATAMAESVERALKYSTTLDPLDAVTQVRDRMEAMKDKDSSKILNEFHKDQNLDPANLASTVSDALTDSGIFDFFQEDVPLDIQLLFKDEAQNAFLLTGNSEDAKATAAANILKVHGETSINGSNEFMMFPPNKMYPGISDEEFRNDLEDQYKEIYPSGDSSGVSIVSGSYTRGNYITDKNGKKQEVFKYYMHEQIQTKDGIVDRIVTDPETGEALIYIPNIDLITSIRDVKENPERYISNSELQKRFDKKSAGTLDPRFNY